MKNLWGREPAVILGVVASLLVIAFSFKNGSITLEEAVQSAMPFITSLFVRPQVTPA